MGTVNGHILRATRPSRLPLLLLLLGVACDSTSGPQETGTLTLLSGFNQADTVFAALPAPLVVELTANGQPAVGVEVVFTAVEHPDFGRGVELSRSTAFQTELRGATDAQGRVSVALRFTGPVAHDARVAINVPRWSRSDTAQYRLLAGVPVSLSGTGYTAVAIGDSARYTPIIRDRHGNMRSDTPDCTTTSHLRAATGCMLHGVSFGTGLVTVRLPAATLQDTVFVVPRGHLAVSNYGVELVTMDGSALMRISSGSAPTWTPAGDSVIYADSTLWIASLAGSRRALSIPLAGGVIEADPFVTRDGAWVYFSASTGDALRGAEIWRVRRDGSSPARVGPRSVGGRHDSRPHVSPDGSLVFYQSCSIISCTTPHVTLLNIQSGEVLDFGPGSSPRFSPSGNAFAAERSGRLSLEPVTGGIFTQFLLGVRTLDWSPDGRYIAFTADISPFFNQTEFGVFLIELATGEMVRLKTLFTPGPNVRPLPTSVAWRPQ